MTITTGNPIAVVSKGACWQPHAQRKDPARRPVSESCIRVGGVGDGSELEFKCCVEACALLGIDSYPALPSQRE